MRKRGFLVVFLGIMGIELFAQQDLNSNHFPVNEVANQNFFFNRKSINPSLINDTVRFDAYWISHKEIAGYSDSPQSNLLSVSGNVFNTNNLYGVEFETYKNGEVKKQTMKFIYGYIFKLNEKSNIKAGASFGFEKFSLPSPDSWYLQGSVVENDWGQSTCASAGFAYNWINHNFGISYLNFIKSFYEYENIEYNLSNKVITANYFSTFKIFRNFNASPEIILADHSGIIDIIIKGNISFCEKFTIGLIFRQSDSNLGIMSKCLLFNKVEFGYLFEKVDDSNENAGSYAHNFKLGFIIK